MATTAPAPPPRSLSRRIVGGLAFLLIAFGIVGGSHWYVASRYFLEPAYWGQGYAIEAARAMVNYATQQLGIRRITAITLPHNTASIRVLSKLGMQHQTDLVWPGEETPSRLYQLLHEPEN